MSKELLTGALVEIAGRNVINGDNESIARLCKCVNYLAFQLHIRAEENREYAGGVLKIAAEILKPQEAANGN